MSFFKSHLFKRFIVLTHDFVVALLAPLMAFILRLGFVPTYTHGMIYFHTLFFVGAIIGLFTTGLNRSSWRYASLDEMLAILKTAGIATAAGIVGLILAGNFEGFPRSLLVLSFAALIMLMGGPRIAFRLLKRHHYSSAARRAVQDEIQRVLIYGYCDAAANFIHQARNNAKSIYDVVGIVSHHPKNLGRELHSVKVVGLLEDLAGLFAKGSPLLVPPPKLVIALPQLGPDETSAIVDEAAKYGMQTFVLPSMTDLVETDQVTAPQAIKIEDLLERQHVDLDLSGLARLFEGKRVLVTGSGGSIGSEICRQIASFKPGHLTLVDNGEFNLYSIEHSLRGLYPALSMAPILCDVRDRNLVLRVVAREKPDVIFHAAALKHVPLTEVNILEAVKTNIFGTRNVADAAMASHCTAMVMISTDKAVNPTNIMGATKRFAEAYCQRLDRNSDHTRFMTVRFGNVLGSAGSVVPLFTRQIAAGGPVTVTHPEIERYFMTIPEAVRLVIAASGGGMSRGMDRGRVLVLEMGKPVKIVDLARRMIQLTGRRPDIDIKIEFVGLRPGEKLYEETFDASEELVPTDSPWLLMAIYRPVDEKVMDAALDRLQASVAQYDDATAVAAILDVVPELTRETHTPGERDIPFRVVEGGKAIA